MRRGVGQGDESAEQDEKRRWVGAAQKSTHAKYSEEVRFKCQSDALDEAWGRARGGEEGWWGRTRKGVREKADEQRRDTVEQSDSNHEQGIAVPVHSMLADTPLSS
jgi:hypothetical protein